MPETTAWPAEIIARHLTKAAEILGDPTITVDVSDHGNRAKCRGCGADRQAPFSREWAVEHAPACRGIPNPSAA